jgi:hypothetical protein
MCGLFACIRPSNADSYSTRAGVQLEDTKVIVVDQVSQSVSIRLVVHQTSRYRVRERRGRDFSQTRVMTVLVRRKSIKARHVPIAR